MDQLGRLAALPAKQIVRSPREVSWASNRAVSQRACAKAEHGVEERGIPDDDVTICRDDGVTVDDRRPWLSPVSLRQLSAFAIVAEASRNCGSAP